MVNAATHTARIASCVEVHDYTFLHDKVVKGGVVTLTNPGFDFADFVVLEVSKGRALCRAGTVHACLRHITGLNWRYDRTMFRESILEALEGEFE